MNMGTKPLLALMFLAGCDPQATGAYEGEPLLSVNGSVELALERDNSADLQPTIAFRGSEGLMYLLDDVAVRGEFPASFELDILAPPPAAAVQTIDAERPDLVERFAVGYITAVTPDLPKVFQFEGQERLQILNDEQSREWSCDLDTDVCFRDEVVCEPECVVQRTTCPTFGDAESNAETCAISEPGDTTTQWEHFAGLSENFAVLYLERSLPARNWLAVEAGEGRRGLAAGYHLIKVRQATADEEVERERCADEARALAFARVNEVHGTSYTGEDVVPLEIEDEIAAAYDAAQAELDCRTTQLVLTRIENPEDESITVRIGPNVEPLSD